MPFILFYFLSPLHKTAMNFNIICFYLIYYLNICNTLDISFHYFPFYLYFLNSFMPNIDIGIFFYRDLSSTSIEQLPTEGLHDLEILRIQNTHSLRTIPSVYNFKVRRFLCSKLVLIFY